MEDYQFRELWKKSYAEEPGYSSDEIRSFLGHSLEKSGLLLIKKLIYDYIISLIISLLIISISFSFSFKYKWIVLLAMTGFSVVTWVHFRLKVLLLNPVRPGNDGLFQRMIQELRLLKFYRNLYRYGIPLFACVLLLVYFLLYLPIPGLMMTGITVMVVLSTSLIVEILWKKIYHNHVLKIKTLSKICNRLSDGNSER